MIYIYISSYTYIYIYTYIYTSSYDINKNIIILTYAEATNQLERLSTDLSNSNTIANQ